MANELVKLRLPNGQVIERPRKIARLFIRGGAEEILPVLKPKELGTKTSPKTPPPIILKEPEISKPDEYPGEIGAKLIEPVNEDKEPEVKEPEPKKVEVKPKAKSTAKKKSTKKK